MNNQRILLCKRVSFVLLALLVIIMAGATFIGNAKGIDYAGAHIYYTIWFALLWAVMAGCGVTWLWSRRPMRSLSDIKASFHLWALHGSLVVILAGAGVSALTSWSGQVHLRLNETTDVYQSDEGDHPYAKLPFKITLTQFDVSTHSGTRMASDYTSIVRVDGRDYRVSMNRVPTIQGVRLYQASYDSDSRGSVLMVRCDRWGQPVTYAGYALLLLAMLTLLLSPRSGMRYAWRALQRLSVLALFLLPATGAMAQNGEAPQSLPREVADEFGELYVSYGGRICPLQTMAQDFCRKIYGSDSWHGYSAEQVMTGWVFWPDDWNLAPIFKVKSRALRNELELPRYATFQDFFLGNSYRLGPLLTPGDPLSQAAAEVDDHLMLVYNVLRRGELFKVFPVKDEAGRTEWIAPPSGLADSQVKRLHEAERSYVTNIFSKIFQDAKAGRYDKVRTGISTIKHYQETHGGDTLPTVSKTRAERLYNSFDLPTWLSRIQLALGLLLFGATFVRRCRPLALSATAAVTGSLAFIVLTMFMGLRTYVSGRLPLGNGYETMLTVAWFVLLIGALMWRKGRRMPVLYCMPFVASGFFLLVAALSNTGSEISQLMPVLNSPLLSMHVSIIMLSYALLTFTFLLSAAALIRPADAERARLQSLVILYPAIALLSVGIFLGAVWANVSWGRYWGWDPKEVWALITLIVYVIPLHAGSITRMRRARAYHLYMLLAFAAVLMTYFGVNYVLTGLHSYA